MKTVASVLAAGILTVVAGPLMMIEVSDQAHARFGGGGGGTFGGGARSFSSGARSFGGGGSSFGAVHKMSSSVARSSTVTARHTSTVSRTITGGTSKHISNVGTNRHVNVAKTNTGSMSNTRKPGIRTPLSTANLGGSHVNIGNKTNKHINIGNTNAGSRVNIGPGGLKQGLAGGPAGLGKLGPGGLKPGLGGLKPPPGGFKPAPGNITVINNRYVNVFRGPRQLWWAGAWVSLAALPIISPLWIGGVEYEPWGYASIAEPVCSGLTPEGYRLSWRDVPTDTGVLVPQCVAYYPRGKAAPAVASSGVPGHAVGAAQPVMSAMAQGCLMEIYSQVAFTGMSSDVAADQPRLSDDGWDKQISSLDVKSGTWDFYSEPDYGGQMVRLSPGQYANLEGWDKQISSFMCAQIQ